MRVRACVRECKPACVCLFERERVCMHLRVRVRVRRARCAQFTRARVSV